MTINLLLLNALLLPHCVPLIPSRLLNFSSYNVTAHINEYQFVDLFCQGGCQLQKKYLVFLPNLF
jgi:hypothetical protein